MADRSAPCEFLFWTSDTGIDGENRDEIDELDLILIDPLASYVWYQDMVDFVEAISDRTAGRRLSESLQEKGAFRRFRNQCMNVTPTDLGLAGAARCQSHLRAVQRCRLHLGYRRPRVDLHPPAVVVQSVKILGWTVGEGCHPSVPIPFARLLRHGRAVLRPHTASCVTSPHACTSCRIGHPA